jgi:enamine deaminase RidA (YjgF/YER057c/UK114 family)
MSRRNIGSGYAFEESYGYSRAVRAGDLIFVSGTTAGGQALEGDAYLQARAILALIEAALVEGGGALHHVVRTVVYVIDLADQEAVARAHREVFADIRPSSTLVQVAALTLSAARVEIEVTAMVG